ncbi:IS5 family transposase [Streptomyces clavifer]|uniref:IS5 family transposase n=1 Tax=Streptomyces clavifer TaxID=68188 RepID=UPI003722B95E
MILADAQWARIESLLPDRTPKRGGRWRDHRQVIDAIAFKYRTGTPWTDLPEHFGSWKGVHNRLRKWAADGTWEKVFTALLAQADSEGDLDWAIAVDSTVVRAHQHAAGARQGALADEPDHHALGRSRGGLTTKIHLAVDGRCRPLAFVLTPGQAGDAPAFPQVMSHLRVPRPIGRPKTTPDMVLADKAYWSRAIRTHLRRRGIRTVIPQPSDQIAGISTNPVPGCSVPHAVVGHGAGMSFPRYRYLVVHTLAGLNSSASFVTGHQPPP